MKCRDKRIVNRSDIFYGNKDIAIKTVLYDGSIWTGPYNISNRRIIKKEKSARFENNGEYNFYVPVDKYNNTLNMFDPTGIISQL
jgi:hypothetical protein